MFLYIAVVVLAAIVLLVRAYVVKDGIFYTPDSGFYIVSYNNETSWSTPNGGIYEFGKMKKAEGNEASYGNGKYTSDVESYEFKYQYNWMINSLYLNIEGRSTNTIILYTQTKNTVECRIVPVPVTPFAEIIEGVEVTILKKASH